ncbi:hypothetical protein VTO42DRAFT_1642 [Malbranchea cinnamomea]
MSSQEIHIVATITPKPEKVDEVTKLWKDLAKKVRAEEPGTLSYYAVRPKGGNQIIIIEKYRNAEAVKVHGNTPYFKSFSATVAPLLAAPIDIKIGTQDGGFVSKL